MNLFKGNSNEQQAKVVCFRDQAVGIEELCFSVWRGLRPFDTAEKRYWFHRHVENHRL